MSEEITSEMISRRATFSLLGAAAALSVAAPATPLTAAEAAFGIRGAFPSLHDHVRSASQTGNYLNILSISVDGPESVIGRPAS